MKSLKHIYITALLSSATSLFAGEMTNTPEQTASTALTTESAMFSENSLFPQEYNSEALKAVPVYLLKMDATKQVLRLKGEYKKGLKLATHHMVELFNHDANKAIDAFTHLDASAQSEILLCAGQEFIKNYLIKINELSLGKKEWLCITEERRFTSDSFKETAKSKINGPEGECDVFSGSYTHRYRKELTTFEAKSLSSWIENLERYEHVQLEDGGNSGTLATIDMLFRYAENKGGTEEMATYLAEIFNNLWDSEDETIPALENILITGEWGSTHSAGNNPQRKSSDDQCEEFVDFWGKKTEEWHANGCDQPAIMEVAATLQLKYLHALISKLDNAQRIPLMERINEKGGLESVLNNEICLSAEEDYFPFVEEELLGKMFEICEKYIYADEIIEALNNEAQYLAIQG